MNHANDAHAADHGHAANGHAAEGHGEHSHHPMHHVMPVWILFAVWIALMVFTGLTVVTSNMALGHWDMVVAMGIATVKAILVCLFFMHLLYDRPFNGFVFLTSLFFVAIFIGMTLLDSIEYQPEINAKVNQTTN